MKNIFIKRLERTPLTDIAGRGRNLQKFVEDMLTMPQEQPNEIFRGLLREILLTESGVTAEELARDEMSALNRRGIER